MIDKAKYPQYPQSAMAELWGSEIERIMGFLKFLADREHLEFIDSRTGCECAYSEFTRLPLVLKYLGIDYDAYQKEQDAMAAGLSAEPGEG